MKETLTKTNKVEAYKQMSVTIIMSRTRWEQLVLGLSFSDILIFTHIPLFIKRVLFPRCISALFLIVYFCGRFSLREDGPRATVPELQSARNSKEYSVMMLHRAGCQIFGPPCCLMRSACRDSLRTCVASRGTISSLSMCAETARLIGYAFEFCT